MIDPANVIPAKAGIQNCLRLVQLPSAALRTTMDEMFNQICGMDSRFCGNDKLSAGVDEPKCCNGSQISFPGVAPGDTGSVLIGVLAVSVFLLVLSLSTTRIVTRSLNETSAQASALTAATLANNELTYALASINSGTTSENDTFVRTALSASVFGVQSISTVGLHRISAHMAERFIALQQLANSFRLPDWRVIYEIHAEKNCNEPNPYLPQSVGTSRSISSVSCHTHSSDFLSSKVFSGNIVAASRIDIQKINNAKITVASLGAMYFPYGIQITDSPGVVVELLGFSGIEIQNVEFLNSPGARVLVHSSNGKLQINTPLTEGVICQLESEPTHQVTLSAGKEIRVENSVTAGPTTIGCSYMYEGKMWPRLMVF